MTALDLAVAVTQPPAWRRPARTLVCSFEVYGEPVPQGSMIPVAGRAKNQRPVVIASNKKQLDPWRRLVHKTARDARTRDGITEAFDCPLAVRLVFTFNKPASYPKTRRSFMATRPDGDKLARAVADSLTTAELIRDDGRFAEWTIRKVFAGEDPEALEQPGVRIAIWTLTDTVIEQPSLLDP